MSPARAIGAWISSAARFAAHTSAGDLVEPAVVDRAAAVAGTERRLHPVGPVRRAPLLEERLVVDAVREAAQRDAAVAEWSSIAGAMRA